MAKRDETRKLATTDTSDLLSTKFVLSRSRSRLVERATLFARLDAGLEQHKLTLLAAPAGFGRGQRHILEYFVADVLNNQPESLQAFLLRTCFQWSQACCLSR
jgi:ATP/maltotriose-dependent transcriptional regulator MalT